MAAENVIRFNGQVLRVIAELYEHHPAERRFDPQDLLPGVETWTRDDEAAAAGTLRWLLNNGYVTGEYHSASGALDETQLTANSWHILQRQDQNTSVQPLGEAVKQAVAAGGREFDVVAELLVRRLHEG